ncbi:MAG: hypothetical protein MI750_14795 [Xanthomonadales bacterium]|nr:hypothetical protein [Xanthomonadales bacterium]
MNKKTIIEELEINELEERLEFGLCGGGGGGGGEGGGPGGGPDPCPNCQQH